MPNKSLELIPSSYFPQLVSIASIYLVTDKTFDIPISFLVIMLLQWNVAVGAAQINSAL